MTRRAPAEPRPLWLSPSQVKALVACERRWYLESQAGASRDGEGGGLYLAFGRLLDEAVERYVQDPAVSFDFAELAADVQAARRPGELAAIPPEKWVELAEKAVRTLRRLVPAGVLPPPGTPAQYGYRVPVPDAPAPGVVLVGRADYRARGRVWDLKTTSDRGPGRGPSADRAPNAFTDRTLRDDYQARMYATAEFYAEPSRASVECTWVYASSSTTAVWSATTTFTRRECLAWFDANVRVLFPRLIELAETEGLAPEEARANHDSCGRCFVRGACEPFTGAQAVGGVDGKEYDVDLSKLRQRQNAVNRPAPVDVEAQLRASLVTDAAAVSGGTQDDRRADTAERPPSLADTAKVFAEAALIVGRAVANADLKRDAAPAVALREELAALAQDPDVALPAADAAPVSPVLPPGETPVKRGRGRPRKPPAEAVQAGAPDMIYALKMRTNAAHAGTGNVREDAIYAMWAADLARLGVPVPQTYADMVAGVTPRTAGRPATSAELERLAQLDAAADVLEDTLARLSAARASVETAAVAARDAAAAARDALRAAGVAL